MRLFLLFFVVFFLTACHQQIKTAQPDSVEVDTSPKATIVFLTDCTYDFGVYGERESKTCDFVFRNEGNVPFVINHIDTSCGCLHVDFPKYAVSSGAIDTIHVTYDGNGFESGFFTKSCDVYSNADSVFSLRVQGTYSKTLEEQWLKEHQQ